MIIFLNITGGVQMDLQVKEDEELSVNAKIEISY